MNLYDKYRHALEAFKDRLLGSSLRDRIARIVVFGSFVKGAVREDSDLDVLVVTNDGDELSDFIADVTLEVQMRHKIGIEPVVVSIDDFFRFDPIFYPMYCARDGRSIACPQSHSKKKKGEI